MRYIINVKNIYSKKLLTEFKKMDIITFSKKKDKVRGGKDEKDIISEKS